MLAVSYLLTLCSTLSVRFLFEDFLNMEYRIVCLSTFIVRLLLFPEYKVNSHMRQFKGVVKRLNVTWNWQDVLNKEMFYPTPHRSK